MSKTHPLPATRSDALTRLKDFVPHAGAAYARLRNYDLPQDGHPHVSVLSPYLRHRVITEAEVVEAVLARHSAGAAEKFLQEVFWRTYWKGWLELRPGAWADYLKGRDQAVAALERDADLKSAVARAEAAETDIAAFNDWVQELVTTGYLHNHARMWFASIWIFTLRLPWELGADFFLRHLLDGDPASNTLSWKWVAGLQTQGKHYIARASNIAKYTDGRHNPEHRLNTQAGPLAGVPHPGPRDAPKGDTVDVGLRSAVVMTEDDLAPGFLRRRVPDGLGCAGLLSTLHRSRRSMSDHVQVFAKTAMEDSLGRWADRFGGPGPLAEDPMVIVDWARSLGVEQIVTPYAPVGPAASRLRFLQKTLQDDGITVVQVLRGWDSRAWPHATHGFFRFKGHIPALIDAEAVDRSEIGAVS